jgi:hypothetical protein
VAAAEGSQRLVIHAQVGPDPHDVTMRKSCRYTTGTRKRKW